jgi:hypothetical protein
MFCWLNNLLFICSLLYYIACSIYGSGNYHGDNRSYDCGGVTFESVSVVDKNNRECR